MDSRLEIIIFLLTCLLLSCVNNTDKQGKNISINNKKEYIDSTSLFLCRLKHIVDSIGFENRDSIEKYYVYKDNVTTYWNCVYLDTILHSSSDLSRNKTIYIKEGNPYDSINIDKCVLIALSNLNYTGYIYIKNISSCINLPYSKVTSYSILKDNEFYTFYGYNYNLK